MLWSQLEAIWTGNFRVLKGDTGSKWVHPLGLEDSHPLGKSLAGEGPEQSPPGVELRAVASLAWFRGQDCFGLVGRHIRGTSCLLP